jgi:hypothetical protein
MRITNPQSLPDGTMEAEIEIMPGEPVPEKARFRKIDGQWKLEMP